MIVIRLPRKTPHVVIIGLPSEPLLHLDLGTLLVFRMNDFVHRFRVGLTLLVAVIAFNMPQPVSAQVTAFRQAIAEAAARDDDLAAFYRAREFEGLWTGQGDAAQARRNALLTTFASAAQHGLPAGRYDPNALMAQMRAARTPQAQGAMDVALSQLFLQYARDVQSGILDPSRTVRDIKREAPVRDRLETMNGFATAHPTAYLRALPPATPEYTRLMREKMRLERLLSAGGWGPTVNADKLEMGDTGGAVIDLRNRLILMGFLGRTASPSYDQNMVDAVRDFQASHGLEIDGTAGGLTLRQINIPLERRLQSVVVAMERERWLNTPRGARHIWVNLTDFSARIIDNDRVTFQTRSVIGADEVDRRSPEFSDVMEFMVINPSWYVPRSIVTKEYLPQLQRNPGAVRHLLITDRKGRQINRNAVNFRAYNAKNFPFSMRQPPSKKNALGLVKFMFPNRYNIYLHDTPAKSLFGRESRAFSHGCIRLNDPFDFAYELLSRQESDPEAFFQSRLRTGKERRVNLEEPVPVHLVYRTAITKVTGGIEFRRDVYGRDRQIWDALAREGVAVLAFQG